MWYSRYIQLSFFCAKLKLKPVIGLDIRYKVNFIYISQCRNQTILDWKAFNSYPTTLNPPRREFFWKKLGLNLGHLSLQATALSPRPWLIDHVQSNLLFHFKHVLVLKYAINCGLIKIPTSLLSYCYFTCKELFVWRAVFHSLKFVLVSFPSKLLKYCISLHRAARLFIKGPTVIEVEWALIFWAWAFNLSSVVAWAFVIRP